MASSSHAALFFILGLIIVFCGHHPFTLPSRVLDASVGLLSVCLYLRYSFLTKTPLIINNHILTLLIAFVAASIVSIFWLPLPNIVSHWIHAPKLQIVSEVFAAPSDSIFYSIDGISRLIAYLFLSICIGFGNNWQQRFEYLFIGVLAGAVLSVFAGLLNFYELISLDFLRDLDPHVNPFETQIRLQSFFGHPGWFAEYVTITIPYVIFLLLRFRSRSLQLCIILVLLILTEAALILSQARAGWITYPLTLLACWVLYYTSQAKLTDNLFKAIKRVALSLPLTIALSIALVALLNTTFSIDRSDRNSLVERVGQVFNASDRISLWREGYDLGLEAPLIGLGYDSFHWRAQQLAANPNSKISVNPTPEHNLPTPHNLYATLFATLGIVGLFLWCAMTTYTSALLALDVWRNKNLNSLPPLISILSFHVYGLFQSMNYIPLVWLILFLNFAYALKIPYRIKIPAIVQGTVFGSVTVCLLGGYTFHMLEPLDEKYPRGVQTGDARLGKLAEPAWLGFHRLEKWPHQEKRWSNAASSILFQEPGPRVLRLTPSAPDQKLTVEANGTVYHQKLSSYTELPLNISERSSFVLLSVDPVTVPDPNRKDNRTLGVAIGSPVIAKPTGLYPLEENTSGYFRWTKARSIISVPDDLKITIAAHHPDIHTNPVEVILSQASKVKTVTLSNNEQSTIELGGFKSGYTQVEVSRTWSPANYGVNDSRKLGVAVFHGRLNSLSSQTHEMLRGQIRPEYSMMKNPQGKKERSFRSPLETDNCRMRDPNLACRQLDESVVFLGDSFVGQYERALTKNLTEYDTGFISLSYEQCPFVSEQIWFGNVAECPYINEQRVKLIEEMQPPKIFVVSANMSLFGSAKKRTNDPVNDGRRNFSGGQRADSGIALRSYFERIQWLSDQGHKVIQLRSTPRPKMNIAQWLLDNQGYLPSLEFPDVINETKPSELLQQDLNNYPQHLPENVVVIDPARDLCDFERDICFDVKKGIGPIYSDHRHLSFFGASLVSEAIVSALIAKGWIDIGD
jgi:hypothetical protein